MLQDTKLLSTRENLSVYVPALTYTKHENRTGRAGSQIQAAGLQPGRTRSRVPAFFFLKNQLS